VKKKKRVSVFLTVIGVILLLLLAAAGILAVAARDDMDVESAETATDARTSDEILKAALSAAFDNTAETGEVSVKLDENCFNALLAAERREADIPYLRGMAAENIGSDTVILKLGIGTSYKTVLRLTVVFSETEDAYRFSVTDAALGKIKLSDGFLKILINAFGAVGKLNELGLDVTVGYSPTKIDISKKSFAAYALSAVDFEGGEGKLFETVLVREAEENKVDASFGKNGYYGVTVDVNAYSYDAARDGAAASEIDSSAINGELKVLLSGGYVKTEQATLCADFLSRGYGNMNDAEKQSIDSIDFSAAGIADAASYGGMVAYEKRSFYSVVLQHLPLYAPSTGELSADVSETDIDELILSDGKVGTVTAFVSETDGVFAVSTIIFESFFTEINDDEIIFRFLLNLNGKRLIFSIYTDAPESPASDITATLSDMKMGAEEAGEEVTAAAFGVMEESLGGKTWISCDTEKRTVNITFADAITNSALLRYAVNTLGSAVSTSFVGKTGGGAVRFAVSLR
jgi:hypothetical protein